MHLTVVICRWSTVHRETHEAAITRRKRKYDDTCVGFGFSSIGHSSVYYVSKPLILKHATLSFCIRRLRHIVLSSRLVFALSEHEFTFVLYWWASSGFPPPGVGGAAYKFMCKPFKTVLTDSCSVFRIEERIVLRNNWIFSIDIWYISSTFSVLFHKSGGRAYPSLAPLPPTSAHAMIITSVLFHTCADRNLL